MLTPASAATRHTYKSLDQINILIVRPKSQENEVCTIELKAQAPTHCHSVFPPAKPLPSSPQALANKHPRKRRFLRIMIQGMGNVNATSPSSLPFPLHRWSRKYRSMRPKVAGPRPQKKKKKPRKHTKETKSYLKDKRLDVSPLGYPQRVA